MQGNPRGEGPEVTAEDWEDASFYFSSVKQEVEWAFSLRGYTRTFVDKTKLFKKQCFHNDNEKKLLCSLATRNINEPILT